MEDVEPLILRDLGMGPHRHGSIFERTLPWVEALTGASRKRGITRTDEIAFRDVFDDGRAAQAALAKGIGERFAVIDGELAIRGGLPRLSVTSCDPRIVVSGGMGMVSWDEDPEWGDAWTTGCFRLDRPEEADAYAEAYARLLGHPVTRPSGDESPVIVDAGAVTACYDRIADENALAMIAVANGIAEAIRPALGGMPDGEIARYLGLKAMAGARDGSGIRDWLDGLPGTRLALARAKPPFLSGTASEMAKQVAAIDAVSVRLDVVDFPRMRLAEDEAALTGLGPGR